MITREVFQAAMDFTERSEIVAYMLGLPKLLFLSGGECTEHPDFLWLLEQAEARRFVPMIVTNGSWLANEELRSKILVPGRVVFVQVTHDPRFYPTAPPLRVEDRRVTYIEALSQLVGLGRAKGKDGKIRLSLAGQGVPEKIAPGSFNLRSAVRHHGSFQAGIAMLRQGLVQRKSGQCSPSISVDGSVVAGESNECYKVGTVFSSQEEITKVFLDGFQCNRCGLESNLGPDHRRAIGI